MAGHTVESGQFAGCSLGPEEACWILRTVGWEFKRASIAYKWPLHRFKAVRGGAFSQNSLNAMFQTPRLTNVYAEKVRGREEGRGLSDFEIAECQRPSRASRQADSE